ncbi:MAG: NAD(P)/FAD-dependent oxidoreductase [Defluviitaleaceae bacterium]|nr:NAD(P)/FAD-dependent oxidoreductase [Defluviitaleaceae bacterium]
MQKLPKHYDTIIVGAGIIGCATARFLGQYNLNILVIESQDDVSCGASKANSGIVHAGYDCYPGTLKAQLNAEGAAMYPILAEELDFPFKTNGSFVLCFNEEDHHKIIALYERGLTNNIPDLKIITHEEAYNLEPNLAPNLHSALWAQKAGIVSSYEANIAFAENAAVNGVEFLLETSVINISQKSKEIDSAQSFTVETTQGTFFTKTIINAAGLKADIINNYINDTTETILPQRGQYYLLDNAHRGFVTRTIFSLPGSKGKGVLIAPTVDENTLIGPNAEDSNDTQTTRSGLDEVLEKAKMSVSNLPIHGRITTFAGVRAKHASKDFVINEPISGFFNALGIDSPGISAAPAIGKKLAQMVADKLNPGLNPGYNPGRLGIKRFSRLSFAEQAALISENPQYGHVVCRCETVTEAEIIDSIRRPIGAGDLAAIKRRTRAQMGRCQGGFCSLKLSEILSKELGVSEEYIWTC